MSSVLVAVCWVWVPLGLFWTKMFKSQPKVRPPANKYSTILPSPPLWPPEGPVKSIATQIKNKSNLRVCFYRSWPSLRFTLKRETSTSSVSGKADPAIHAEYKNVDVATVDFHFLSFPNMEISWIWTSWRWDRSMLSRITASCTN